MAGDPNDALHRVTSLYNWMAVHHAAARCPPLPAVLRSQHRHGSELGAGAGAGHHPHTAGHTQFAVSITHID